MKVSLNWLTDYVDVAVPAKELGDVCTRIGLNLEEIIETDTDIVLDLEVTSNRSDCLGHLGVAREIAAATGAKFTPPAIGELPTSGKAAEMTSVEVLAPDLCPRYTARVIRNVKVGPSPQWLIERLEAVGLRSINNVVDVTNFVLMEYSQPLHCFDFDKLAGGKIIVRRGKPGEVMVSIDETTCKLDENMLVIADAEKAVAIAGIMGGLGTEVTEATTSVLIEAAQFDPLTTRRTSRKLQLMSDSNYRFERGVDPVRLEEASLRACQLILDLAGGELAEGVVDVCSEPWQPRTVALRPERCNKLLGTETPVERQMELLDALGLDPKSEDGKIVCTIPSHRADLSREVDLIEEVARLEGFEKIPVSAKITHAVAPESTPQRTRRTIGEAMTAAGFDETVTSSFVDPIEAELFGEPNGVRVSELTRKSNNVLRPTVIPSLLRSCKNNQDAGATDVSLYELAAAFPPGASSNLPAEHIELAAATTRELRELLGAIEAATAKVAPDAKVEVRQQPMAGFADDIGAELLLDGEPAGRIGIVSDKALDQYGLNAERPIAAAAIRFDVILARAGRVRTYEPVAKFPAVRRDLSVVVDEAVTWRQLLDAIDGTPQPQRVSIAYITTYRGKQIGGDRKSVSFTVTYRDPAATLRSEQVDEQVADIISALKENFSAELRA